MSASKTTLAIAGVVLAALLLPLSTMGQGGVPAADKAVVAGSTIEHIQPSGTATLLSATIKTSGPTDLLLSLTAECALWTTVETVGNDVSESQASIKTWIELDGTPVAINGADTGPESGKVVLCDRLHRQTTTLFDDDDATIRQFLNTRSANGFNWAALNVGSGTHTLVVKGEFFTATTEDADGTRAAVGHRTLIVEPTKMANGAEIEF